MIAATGTVMESTYGFQFVENDFAGRPRNAIEDTCVAKIESATAHVGSRPLPVVNPSTSFPPPLLRNAKLHPNSVIPIR